jgi:hypothetical protein
MEPVTAREILEAVRCQLASYGLAFTHDKLELAGDPGMWKGTLRFGDSQTPVRVALAAPMTLTALARVGLDDQHLLSSNHRTLVVGRHVHERSADAFREMGVGYADTAGNAYIRFAHVMIDVRGRRAPRSHDRLGQVDQGTPGPRSNNLFSTGRAQVIATLLAWPELTGEPVREIAQAAGVSTGQAYSALTLLEETGYLVRRELRSERFDELLELWTAAYPRGLGQKLAVASYASTQDIQGFRREVLSGASPAEGFALSGEAVPDLGLKRPRSITVYTPEWTPRQAVRHRWRAAGTAEQPDIHVRRKFWTPPRTAGRHDPIAPWPVVYADLMTAGDERLTEAASGWRDRHRTA